MWSVSLGCLTTIISGQKCAFLFIKQTSISFSWSHQNIIFVCLQRDRKSYCQKRKLPAFIKQSQIGTHLLNQRSFCSHSLWEDIKISIFKLWHSKDSARKNVQKRSQEKAVQEITKHYSFLLALRDVSCSVITIQHLDSVSDLWKAGIY